jgi:VWFA-related protein
MWHRVQLLGSSRLAPGWIPAGAVCVFVGAVLAQEPSFRAGADFVLLDVSATDSHGTPVSGLLPENFQVKEDGRLRNLISFDHGSANVTLALVADFSGSMKPRHQPLVDGVAALVAQLDPRDDARLLTFNETAAVLAQQAPADWPAAVLASVPTGQTALYDAVLLAAREAEKGRYQRRVIVVLSDGEDTASRAPRSIVFDELRASNALVYCVGLFEPGDANTDAGVLRSMAERTGGLALFDPDAARLPEVFRAITLDLRARYVLTFRAADIAAGERAVRKLSVDARNADGKRLRVRSRREYVIEGR